MLYKRKIYLKTQRFSYV